MKNLFSLEGKVVLITGGSGGIGSALVDGFLVAGARVGNFDKVSPNSIHNKHGAFWKVDLSKFSNIAEAFENFIKHFGRIDILVNCAGVTQPCSDLDYPLSLWKDTIKVNLDAVFCLCKLAGIEMIKQGGGGSIINFTSINAAQAMPNNPAYAAAKSGVRLLTKSLALDWGKYNIRVNNIGPGYTKTPMNRKSLNDAEACKLRADSTMLGRWAMPREMVGPTIFLASEASSYVTGTDLWIDGGWLAKGIL